MSDENEQSNALTHSEQAMAYYADDLSPAEKAAFEAHLTGCAECQKLLADANRLLPAAEGLLAMQSSFKPKHTVEEQVRRFDALVRAEQAQQIRRYRFIGLALAAAVAAVMGFAAYEELKPAVHPERHLYAPVPHPDAG